MKRIVTWLLLTLVCLSAGAQKADLRKGNRQFKQEKYAEADISYRKALMQDSSSVAARYNLANTLYRQQHFDEAASQLDAAAENAPAQAFAADYYFNKGDVAMAREDWQGAVDALKECLLRTPDDLQAKENYIYARNKLMEQQGGGGGGDNDQDQQQDQNQDQDQQNQDQNQDQQQNQQDQNKDQQQQQQQPQEQEAQLTPQQAQQLLQAIQDKEKQTQEKVDAEKAKALKSKQKEKNW